MELITLAHREQGLVVAPGNRLAIKSLARALVLEPELLLLDEPFSSLDPPAREAILGDLE